MNTMNISFANANENANAITHGGIFHADEVFATVILGHVMPEVKLRRVFSVPENTDAIVYDIGGGRFDHHQRGRNGSRENGVWYSSAGLLWKEFGMQVCADMAQPERAFHMIDEMLFQGIDALDNGMQITSETDIRVMSVSSLISQFNPRWDESASSDEKFMQAVSFAWTVFENTLKSVRSTVAASATVEAAYNKAVSEDQNVLVMEKFVPWQGTLLQIDEQAKILFVVYPSVRGGWNWQTVPQAPGSFEARVASPKSWWGQPADKLCEISGVATANFTHPNGFLGSCDTKDDAIAMAKMAIAAAENA